MAASSAAYHYDVAPDGQRFLLIEPPGASTVGTAPMIVVSACDKLGPCEIPASGRLSMDITVYFLTARHIWIFPP